MPDFADSGPVILALAIGIFAPLSGWVARQRARSAALWFAIGAFSGPFALLILAAAPPGRCPDCDRPVPGWDRECRFCGASFPPFWEEEAERPGRRPQPRRPEPAVPLDLEAVAVDRAPTGARSVATTPARVAAPPVAAAPTPPEAAPPAEEAAAPEPAPARARRRGKAAAATVGQAAGRTRRTRTEASPPALASDTLAHEAPRPARRSGPPPVQPVTSAPRPTDPEPVRPAADPRAPASEPPPPEPEPEMERVLSTGIYILGNAGLEVGARYGLARVGDRLRVFGPVDLGEVTVRHERRYAELEVTAIGDQLVISAVGKGSNLAMVFRGLGGMQPAEIERVLSARPSGNPPTEDGAR